MHKYNLKDFAQRYGLGEHESMKVAETLKPGTWLAGGCLRDMLMGKIVGSDFDFFAKSEAALHSITPEGAIEHDNHRTAMVDGKPHQFIKVAWYESAEQLIDSFDFTICQLATDGTDLFVGEFTLFDIGRKRLQVHKITHAIATVRRCFKYMKYGFTACEGTYSALLDATEEAKKSPVLYVD